VASPALGDELEIQVDAEEGKKGKKKVKRERKKKENRLWEERSSYVFRKSDLGRITQIVAKLAGKTRNGPRCTTFRRSGIDTGKTIDETIQSGAGKKKPHRVSS